MEERLKTLQPYLLGEISREILALRKKGKDIVDLSQIKPDLPPPELALEVLVQASLRPEHHRYSASKGVLKLRQAVAALYQRKFGVSLDPETEVIATMGSKEGMSSALLGTLDPGAGVLLPSPGYPVHAAAVMLSGGHTIDVPLVEEWSDSEYLKLDTESFLKRIEEVSSSSWPRPTHLILSFPHNPTSCTLTLDDWKAIVDFAKSQSLFLINDFAYMGLDAQANSAPSLLQVDESRDIGIELFSLSKGYGLPGWRVGFGVGNRDAIHAMTRVKSYTDFGIFSPLQLAATELLAEGDEHLKTNCDIYSKRSAMFTDGLRKLGWFAYQPAAGVVVWARPPESLTEGMESGQGLARMILDKTGVACSPGAGFGGDSSKMDSGKWLRFALVLPEENLQVALDRLAGLSLS